MGLPLVIVAVLLALFTRSQGDMALWLSVTLYVFAGIFFIVGLATINSGRTGMASLDQSLSADTEAGEEKDP